MKVEWSRFAHFLEFRTDLNAPTRLDVALVEALMLFPDDEVWRARAAQSSCVEFFSAAGLEFMATRAILDLQELTRHAVPIENVQEEVKRTRFAHGMIAGLVLHDVICMNVLDARPKTISAIARGVISRFRAGGCRVGMETFNHTIWPRFRPVVHFWAAALKHNVIDDRVAFPCGARRFREFLADAEWYRVAGEETQPPRAPGGPVLRKGAAFMLPPNLRVEPSALFAELSP